MRIGVDVLAIQSPYSAGRGIGRYGRHFLDHLLRADDRNEYVLYTYENLPIDQVPTSDRVTIRNLQRDPSRHEHSYEYVADRMARANPDQLDWLLILSPFETWQFYGLPAKPLNGLKIATVLYDLIPFLFQETYLREPKVSAWFHGHLERLRTHDLLLAISDATRRDALRLLDLPESRVVTVGTASDPSFFQPALSGDTPALELQFFGLTQPFVFCLGSHDPRKNLECLFLGFSLLPRDVRESHELVVACALSEAEKQRTMAQAETHGVADRLRLVGEIHDRQLRAFYQSCSAFVFPSLYEGFGLPLLEAMHCGTPVIAGNNSAQPEVVGDAGLLVCASDAGELATAMERVLRDRSLARMLGEAAHQRAARFSWDQVARTALDSLESSEIASRRSRTRLVHSRPHLACFTPLPPLKTGIADYAGRLLPWLGRTYRVDLYHSGGYVPDLELKSDTHSCRSHSLFQRYRRLGIYGPRLLYQMGNSHFHHYLYPTMLEHPGVVVLHDFALGGFHHGYEACDSGRSGHLEKEVLYSHPERLPEFQKHRPQWDGEPGGLGESLARHRFDLNRRVLDHARAVIFHSEWCRAEVSRQFPDLVAKSHVIPMGAEVVEVSQAQQQESRRALGLDDETLIMVSVGILHPVKMNVPTVEAFAQVVRKEPRARLVFAGRDLGHGETRQAVERLGLGHHVRFLGHCSPQMYADAIKAADFGICLRRPPTKGETSAALVDLLRHGRAAIVCATGSFQEWPDEIVKKLTWTWTEGDHERLVEAMLQWTTNSAARQAAGETARRYVSEHCAWNRVAERYRQVLESVAA